MDETKLCKKCNTVKARNCFYSNTGNCKPCSNKVSKEYRRKNHIKIINQERHRRRYCIESIWLNRHSQMRRSVEGRSTIKRKCTGRDICTQQEFLNWCEETRPIFMKMHKEWEESGFKRKFIPSIDRIDNDGGYALDNIQWLTLSENSAKDNLQYLTTARTEDGKFMKRDY